MDGPPEKKAARKFVVAFNRDRDSYQVALAMAEAGMLDTFVTDFYASSLKAKLMPRLRHRKIDGLDARLTRSSPQALLLQVVGPRMFFDLNATLAHTHKALGAKARAVARRSNADLLLYSEHAFEAFRDPRLWDRRKLLFSFHPHRKLIGEIMAADKERFPEIAWGLRDETPSMELETRENAELAMAQFVLCASSFTKRSLIYAGVDAAKIAVVPYGAQARSVAAADRDSVQCRFLFVGQGVQRKGLHHLLKVWNELALPNATLTLVCYRMDPAIAELAGAHVQILAGLPQAELDAVFARSHVFVMPSLVEGFGLVFLEAMAAGCFVIGTENTGLPDLNMPRELGSVVEAGELGQLAEVMEAAYKKHWEGLLPHEGIAQFAQTRSWALFRERLRDEVGVFLERAS